MSRVELMEDKRTSQLSPKPAISAPHRKAPLQGIEIGKNRLNLIALDALLQQKGKKTIKDGI